MILQIPTPGPGDLEKWLVGAAAAAALYVLLRSVFGGKEEKQEYVRQEEFRLFRNGVERAMVALRDRIDSRHLGIVERLDKLSNTLLHETTKQTEILQARLAQLESGLARLDERSKGKGTAS